MRLYSVANVIIRKFNQHNQVNFPPLVLKLKGSDYQQSGERNPSAFNVRWEAIIPYLARLLGITMNSKAYPSKWKKFIVVPIYKGEIDRYLETIDRSA